ncbi:MAG: short-chain dehydrogenase [Actinomycetia bacterium]|nr:short-chain dehydrogenase [Actinomycetes bacterium]
MEHLGGKVVAVTGGASGIGLAMATRFQAAGMQVALGDIEAGPLATAVAGLGGDAAHVLGMTCDVTSPASMEAFHDAVLDRFGAVHVVCLNAGVATSGPLLETPIESWRWLLEVNVLGIVNGLAAFGPGLVEQGEGHIVCTASASGLLSAPALGAYGATKHAVVGLAAVLRDELAPAGVGVSAVCPGVVRTRIFESERNRPASMDGPTHLDAAQAGTYLHVAEQAPGPELVADAVHDAVVANQLFVLPSPEVNGLILARMDEVRAALPPKP